jgi:hypothetical protein
MAVAHDMFAAAPGTANALRPTRLTHKFETFRVIEQRLQIDQNAHGSNLSRISVSAVSVPLAFGVWADFRM